MATKLKAQYVSIGITLRVIDPNSDPKEPKTIDLNENIQLNLLDEKHVDRVLTENPYVGEIIPVIIQALVKKYDPSAAKAKAFSEKLKDVVSFEKDK